MNPGSAASRPTYALPAIGRAGLGNELFPWMRALDYSISTGAVLLPANWYQPRIGPLLRGERDSRQYWRLFKTHSAQQHLRGAWLQRRPNNPRLHRFSGMADFFASLQQDPREYVAFLRSEARQGVISTSASGGYLSVHIRLGDFARGSQGAHSAATDNTSVSPDWYATQIRSAMERKPGLRVVVSSDGSDDELECVLKIEGVARSTARNALDEIFVMAASKGMIGSRSSFTAWGSFLGTVPLLLAQGGNAFKPHNSVFDKGDSEAFDAWIRSWT